MIDGEILPRALLDRRAAAMIGDVANITRGKGRPVETQPEHRAILALVETTFVVAAEPFDRLDAKLHPAGDRTTGICAEPHLAITGLGGRRQHREHQGAEHHMTFP